MGSIPRMTKPYRAAMKENWDSIKKFYENHNEMVSFPMTVGGDTVLHIAAHSGKTEFVKELINEILGLKSKGSSPQQGFPLFDELAPLRRQNEYGNTVLHEAASGGHLKMVELLLGHDAGLLEVKNNRGETPLFRAAAFGRTKVVRSLALKVQDMGTHLRRYDTTTILHIAVLGRYFETALELLQHDVSPDLVDDNGMTCFQLLANMPSAFSSGYSTGRLAKLLYYCLPEKDVEETDDLSLGAIKEDLETGNERKPHQGANHPTDNQSKGVAKMYCRFWRCTAQALPAIGTLWDIKKKQSNVRELIKILAKRDLSWIGGDFGGVPPDEKIHLPVKERDDIEDADQNDEEADQSYQARISFEASYNSETPLIAAARNGILEIVETILEVYPQAIEHVNHKNENIFHVAARYRRVEILDLLQKSHVPISRLRRKITADGDSILHKAAYLGQNSLRDRPGEALRMQSEIQWFKRVQKIVPPYFVNHRNKDGFTAQTLFSRQHKDLVKRGQEWLMRTTQACTLVAVLIATVAFTCAYTVPGGSNSKTGHPLLLKKTPFIVFTTSDTLSLCFALTSVVVFLSIMTSKMQEQDFRRSLPLKLVLGLTTLFFAVASMMVAFAATLVLMIRQRLHWAAIPIYTIACCPVTIFLVLQFPLYLNIAWFTVQDLVQSFIASVPGRKCLNPSLCGIGGGCVHS